MKVKIGNDQNVAVGGYERVGWNVTAHTDGNGDGYGYASEADGKTV
jgi:hypothetical protein